MRIWGNSYLIATAILAATTLGHAQSSAPSAPPDPQPCTTSPQPQPCAPATPAQSGSGSKVPATDRFPFPGETSAPPVAPETPKTISPSSAAPSTPTGSSADRFPFPGENTPAAPLPGSSSSSSADPTAFPDDAPTTPDPNAPTSSKDNPAAPPGHRLLKRVNPVGTKLQTSDEREAEDLSVARFYTDQGNLQAAYLRTQDAVKTMPDDPDAHCSLAQAALKLNKRDEAIAEFNACLKLDPVEKQAKDARRELTRLK